MSVVNNFSNGILGIQAETLIAYEKIVGTSTKIVIQTMYTMMSAINIYNTTQSNSVVLNIDNLVNSNEIVLDSSLVNKDDEVFITYTY